jgi:hypothetical protein
MVEGFWRMLKQRHLRLKDDFDDDDSPFVQEAVTLGQRAPVPPASSAPSCSRSGSTSVARRERKQK